SKFYLSSNLFVRFCHKIVPIICLIFVLVAALQSIKTFLKTKSLALRYYIKIIYVTLVCLIGPGIIIHGVIKETYDRARPHQIHEFGGNKLFTPAFVKSNQCDSNCSFVSGHASVGFMFYSLAFLVKGRKRILMNITATILGLIFGLTRIMEGGHFLSDIIFAGLTVYVTAFILDKIINPLKERHRI
ncbi:MAG: phosphatase PAP2 family protein, partial [Sediminibacterium sp.]